jgi:hypothetical protein
MEIDAIIKKFQNSMSLHDLVNNPSSSHFEHSEIIQDQIFNTYIDDLISHGQRVEIQRDYLRNKLAEAVDLINSTPIYNSVNDYSERISNIQTWINGAQKLLVDTIPTNQK